jgi:hypothetical protein
MSTADAAGTFPPIIQEGACHESSAIEACAARQQPGNRIRCAHAQYDPKSVEQVMLRLVTQLAVALVLIMSVDQIFLRGKLKL